MAVAIKAAKKVQSRELSPELVAIRLPEGKKAHLVNGKIAIIEVVVKIAEVKKEEVRVEEKPAIPVLTGSEKQVAWATTIRAGFMEFYKVSRPKMVAKFLLHTEAAWWIENRFGMGVTNADQRAIQSLWYK